MNKCLSIVILLSIFFAHSCAPDAEKGPNGWSDSQNGGIPEPPNNSNKDRINFTVTKDLSEIVVPVSNGTVEETYINHWELEGKFPKELLEKYIPAIQVTYKVTTTDPLLNDSLLGTFSYAGIKDSTNTTSVKQNGLYLKQNSALRQKLNIVSNVQTVKLINKANNVVIGVDGSFKVKLIYLHKGEPEGSELEIAMQAVLVTRDTDNSVMQASQKEYTKKFKLKMQEFI